MMLRPHLLALLLIICALLLGTPASASSISGPMPRPRLADERYINVYGFRIGAGANDAKIVAAFDGFFAKKHLRGDHRANEGQVDVQIDPVTRLSLILFEAPSHPEENYYLITMRVKPNPAPFSEVGRQYLRELRLHMIDSFAGTGERASWDEAFQFKPPAP